jgi:hypothetical protein
MERGHIHEVGNLPPDFYIPAGAIDTSIPNFGDDTAEVVTGPQDAVLVTDVYLPPQTGPKAPKAANGNGNGAQPLPAYDENKGPGTQPQGTSVADEALITQMAIDTEAEALAAAARRTRFWLWVGGAAVLGYLVGRTR